MKIGKWFFECRISDFLDTIFKVLNILILYYCLKFIKIASKKKCKIYAAKKKVVYILEMIQKNNLQKKKN